MELVKRKYIKKTLQGRITVKHYLNSRLKPVTNPQSLIDGKDRYPVYLRLVVSGKTFDMKSKITFPIALDEFDLTLVIERNIFYKEVLQITEIIEESKPFEDAFFTLKSVANKYHFLSTSFQYAIENILVEKINALLDLSFKYNESETLKELKRKSPELFFKYDISILAKTQKEIHDAKLSDIIKNKLKFKNTNSYHLIQIIITNSLNNHSVENQYLSNILTKDNQKYIALYKQYSLLWMFWADYYNTILEKSRMIELTPNDWINNSFIQKIVLGTYPEIGQELINQINDLFSSKT